ncbi:MAG: hypothetical protein FJ225_09225 [Lentisphaerae bacterium]|nr:hypothetical protein [Lentisphaerota bacterium]
MFRRKARPSLLSEAMDTARRHKGSPHDDASDLRAKMSDAGMRTFVWCVALAVAALAVVLGLFLLCTKK